MLRIPIIAIGENGYESNLSVTAEDLPQLASESVAEEIAFTGPIAVFIRAIRNGKTIDIQGRIHYSGCIRCCRCLDACELKMDTEFAVTAMPAQLERPAGQDHTEIELSADDMNVMDYHGETIDLRDELAQHIVMALPIKPLCDSSCKGLCGGCGANLNKRPCSCPPVDTANPFAALKNLSFSDSTK